MAVTLPLDDQLCFSLYATSMAVNRVYKPMLDALGITYPQYLVLHALWEQDGRTVGSIAERLSLESSTVTPLVKRLEGTGFLVRKRNAADERRVEVWLTQAGTDMCEKCGCLAEGLLKATGLTAQQLHALNDQLKTLWSALKHAEPRG
ncbi:MAG: MarR family transcriptional regulator [Sphingobium sp.]